jgi:hypothetical protein
LNPPTAVRNFISALCDFLLQPFNDMHVDKVSH